MDEQLFRTLEKEELICERCKLLIPFIRKKGPKYTCTSFTIVDDEPICYRDYHPKDFEKVSRKK